MPVVYTYLCRIPLCPIQTRLPGRDQVLIKLSRVIFAVNQAIKVSAKVAIKPLWKANFGQHENLLDFYG